MRLLEPAGARSAVGPLTARALPWTARVVHWGGMVSAAAAAGMMMFAVATAPETTLLPVTQSPSSPLRRGGLSRPSRRRLAGPALRIAAYAAPETDLLLPGRRLQMKMGDETAPRRRTAASRTAVTVGARTELNLAGAVKVIEMWA